MRTIELTQGQVAKVSDHRFDELNIYQWHAWWNKSTKSFYAVRNVKKEDGKRTIVYMHRQINNTPDGFDCDHKDHDTLNNQDYNLRKATRSQNNMNSRLRPDNELKEKCICKNHSSFMVQINKNGKKVFCKTYKTLEDAIIARDEAVKKHYGEFSYLS